MIFSGTLKTTHDDENEWECKRNGTSQGKGEAEKMAYKSRHDGMGRGVQEKTVYRGQRKEYRR